MPTFLLPPFSVPAQQSFPPAYFLSLFVPILIQGKLQIDGQSAF